MELGKINKYEDPTLDKKEEKKVEEVEKTSEVDNGKEPLIEVEQKEKKKKDKEKSKRPGTEDNKGTIYDETV